MSLSNLDLTVLFQQINIDASSLLLIFNISFIVLLVLAALIGLIRGVWRAGFRFLFVLTALITLWFLSPGIIESLLDYPMKSILESQGWEAETLRELPAYLANHGDFSEDLKVIFSNADLQALLLGLIQAILTFVVFFVGGLLIILLSWPLSTLLYAFIRYLIPKKWRKEHKVRWAGALFGLVQALVSFSVLLMPLSVVNNALENIDRKNLEGNKEILTFYDLGRIYGDSFAGQLFSVLSLPFSNGAKTQLWASDQLLTMKFKSNSIVLTDEIDVFMTAFDELIKAGVVDVVYEADTGLTVYFNSNIGNYQLPSGSIDVSNKGSLESLLYNAKFGSSAFDFYGANAAYNPYLWDHAAINNQFNLPYFQNGYVYEGGQLVLDPTYQMVAYLQKLGFEFDPGKLDAPTLTAYIESYLPHVKLSDPNTWGIEGNYSVSSVYDVAVLQKIIDANLPKITSVPLVLNPQGAAVPSYNLDLASYFNLGSTGSLAAIMAANLPYFNINFNTWKVSVSSGSLGNITLPKNGTVNIDNNLTEAVINLLSPELVKELLNIISESDLVVNTIPIALDIALVLPALEEYIDASKINPSDLELTTEEWAAEIKQLGEVASILVDLDVISDVLNGGNDYFGYDPEKVERLGFEFAKLKLVNTILPAALPAVLPNVVPEEYYEGLGLADIDFKSYNWETELQKISTMAANALKLDLQGIVDSDIDYFTQDSEAVAKILNTLTESELIMDIIPKAIDYALNLDVVKEYTKDVEINLPEVNWAAEINNLGSVYAEIAKVGGNPLDVKWGLTDAETAAKAAAIEAAIDLLFSSQLINGLLPTLAEIGVNYLEDPFKDAIDPNLIDFEELNLSEEVKGAFRVYRLVVNEDGSFNDKILTYSDEKVRQIADFIGNSDIIVPLLPNAIVVLGAEYEIDKYVDLNKEDFEDVSWADTIYNLVGVAQYFIDEENEPRIDIINLTEENIVDIATRLDGVPLINKLLPSAINNFIADTEFAKYYNDDLVDFSELNLGTEIGHILRILKLVGFEFDIKTQDYKFNLNFTTYDEDMIDQLEAAINASKLLKDLSPALLEFAQDQLPDSYKDLINLKDLDLSNLGTEIAKIIRVIKTIGGEIDLETGEIKLNLDFATYTDEMIEKITTLLGSSNLLDQLFRAILGAVETIIKDETGIEIDLDEYVTEEINIGIEAGTLIRVARELKLKISEDFKEIDYDIALVNYADDRIDRLAKAIGDSALVNKLLPASVDIALDYIDEKYAKLIDKDAYDFDSVDLERDLKYLLKAARLFVNADNELIPRFYDLTDEDIAFVAEAIGEATLLKMVIDPTISKLSAHAEELFGIDIAKYVDLTVITSYAEVDWVNEFDAILRIARSLVAINHDSEEMPYTIKYKTTAQEREDIAYAIDKMYLIEKLLPSALEKASALEELKAVKDYIELTDIDLDKISLGNEIKGVLEILDVVADDYFELKINLDLVNKDGVIHALVEFVNNSALVKEVATLAYDKVYDKFELSKYISADLLDFETIRLGDEIKPFLLVVASVIEDNSIDERLRIDDTEYARIELSFDNATLIPTIIKDAKSNLPSILDGFSAGLSDKLSGFFDFDAYDIETDINWSKEIVSLIKIATQLISVNGTNVSLDLQLSDSEIEVIGNEVNNLQLIIRAVDVALLTTVNNEDLYKSFLKDVELIEYYDPSGLDLSNSGKLGNDFKQLLKIAREFITNDNKFEFKLSEISDDSYAVIASSVNKLEIVRHVLETVLTRPYHITIDGKRLNSTDYITFDDYFVNYNLGSDVVRLIKAAAVFVSDDYKFELKMKFTVEEMQTIAENVGNLKLLRTVLVKGVNAVAKYFEVDNELVNELDIENVDLVNEIYQLLRVANALDIDLDDPVSMLDLSEEQYNEIGDAVNELTLVNRLLPVAAGFALSYFSNIDLVNQIDLDDIDFDRINLGDEFIRIFKVLQVADFELVNEDGKLGIKYNSVINSYTHEQIDIIADQLGNSELVNQLLPIAAKIGVGYIPADYKQFVDLDLIDFDEIDLEVEIANIAKAAIIFFDANNALVIDIAGLNDENVNTIAKVGNSAFIKMLINHAVYTFADSDLLSKFDIKIDINDYVDLKSIDYSALDFEVELRAILNIARQVLVVKDMKFDYRLDLDADQRAVIEESINSSVLLEELLVSAVDVFATNDLIEPYVDLSVLDIESLDLGKEISRILEIASAISGVDGKLVLSIELLQDDDLVELAVSVLNDLEIIKRLAPSAVDKLFVNKMLLDSGINLSDYLDQDKIDVTNVKWGDEVRPALYAVGALSVVDNTLRLSLNLADEDYDKIAEALNKSTLIPQLIDNAHGNAKDIINRFVEGDLYGVIANFVNIGELDLTNGINWGDELVGLVKVASKVISIIEVDGSYKIELDPTIKDEAIEAARSYINSSELIVRIAENALETTVNNTNLLGMIAEPFKGMTIAEYHDFSDLDLRGTYKLGDEIANILYIARNFITDDLKISLDLGNIDEATYEAIETNVNKSKLIPYLVDVAAHVALENLGFRIEDVDIMIKSLVNLDDVDLLSIEYGSEIAKLLRSAMVFKVADKNEFALKLSFTDDEVLTIADNLGTSELLDIALEKGIIAGLKLFGLDEDITIEDIKFDEIVIRDELYHLLSVASVLNLDIKDIIASINLNVDDVKVINEHLSNSKILEYVTPVALTYVVHNSVALFGMDLQSMVDPADLDLDVINWGDEISAVLALVASLVDNNSGEILINFNINEEEALLIEENINKSELIPQLINYFVDNIDKYFVEDILDQINMFVDLSTLDLVDGINLGSEVVGIIKIANEIIQIEVNDDYTFTFKLYSKITDRAIEVARENINNSELIVRIVENAIETSINNPDLLGMFGEPFKGMTIAEYYDFSDLDLRGAHKLGDEIANVLTIARHFITRDYKIAFDFSAIDDEALEDIKLGLNGSKLVPYLAEAAASVAVNYLGIRIQDTDFIFNEIVDLSGIPFDEFEYGDEVVKFIKIAQIFYAGDNKIELKYRFSEEEVETIANGLGTSKIVKAALEKGINVSLVLFNLLEYVTFDELEFDTWNLEDEFTYILNIVNTLDVDLDAPLSMLKLSDDQISDIASSIRMSKLIDVALPVAISYVVNNSEMLFKFDVSSYFDPSLISYDQVDWGNEATFVLATARHLISDDNKFSISTDMDFIAIVDDVYEELNDSKLVPQALNIALELNSEFEFKFNNTTYKLSDLINKDRIDFTDYVLGDEIKLLSDAAKFYLGEGLSFIVDIDLTDEQYDVVEENLNNSLLLKDLLGNVLDTAYLNDLFEIKKYLDLPETFSFDEVNNWGSEFVNIARLAAKHIDFKLEDNKMTFTYSLANVGEADVVELEKIISESDLLPVVLPAAIRGLDTFEDVNELVEKFIGVTINDLVTVDDLELDIDWSTEVGALARIALTYLENGAFVLRICKTEAEIQVIETNLEKSELVKEIVPLVFDGLVNNYQTILDKFNIDIHVESYIDVSQLSLDDIDIAKEVGIGLRLVNPIFDEINRIKFTIDSMDEEFIENVRVQINRSDLIPYIAELVFERVIVEDSFNYRIANYVDLDGFAISDYLLGDEIAHALRIVKIFDVSDGIGFDDIKVAVRFDLTDEEIGIIEEEVNNSILINDMVPRVANHLYVSYQEPKRFINLDDFDYSKYSYGSELAVALKVAREVITIEGSSFDLNSYTYDIFSLEEESIEKIGNAINESELIPDLVPLAIDRLQNYIFSGNIQLTSILDVDTLNAGVGEIVYGDEIKLALRLAKVYDNSVEGTELVSVSDEDIEIIRTNVNASKLVRLLVESTVNGLVSSNKFNINKWIDLTELDLDELTYGDEVAELLYVARELFNFDTQKFSNGELANLSEADVDNIATHLNNSKLVAQALPLAIRQLDSNDEVDKYIDFNFRDYIDVLTLDLDGVKFGDEFKYFYYVAGLFTSNYIDFSFDIKYLTEDDINVIKTQLNQSVLIGRVIPNVAKQDAVKTYEGIDSYVDLDLIDFTIDAWGSEIASAIRIAQLIITDDNMFELRYRFSNDEINIIKDNVASSVLIPRVLNAAVETIQVTNVHSINDWVVLADVDTGVVNWADEIASALVILSYYSSEDGSSVNINHLTEDELSDVRTRLNESNLVKQLAPGAIVRVYENDLYDVSNYVDLTAVSYDDITLWGDEVYYALSVINHYILGFGEYDINYAYITDEVIESVRALGNNSKLIEKLAPVALATSRENNVHEVNYWVDLSVIDTDVISWGDEAAELLRVARIFSDGYSYFIKYNFTEEEIEIVKEVANNSELVKQLAPSALNTLGEVDRFEVLTYAAGLAEIDFTVITAWGDELASVMQVLNVVMYEDGYVKIFYPFSDGEIEIVKDAVNASKLVPLVAPDVINTFDTNNLYDINLYVNLAGLDYSSVKWGDEAELALQVISYFSPNEGSFELLFNSLTDDQIDRLSQLAGQSKLIPLVAPRAVSNAFDYGHFDIYEWLDESAFDYDAIDYGVEVKAALLVLKDLTDEFGEFIYSINFTDEQIATVKEAVAMSSLVGMIAPSFVEHASTNYLTIASDLIDHTVFDYDKIVYADEVERVMKVIREFAADEDIFHMNVQLLDDEAVEVVATNLGSSEIVNQAAESTIELALVTFEIPYIEFEDMDFTDVDYTNEIRTLINLMKIIANEDGEITEDEYRFDVLETKADEIGSLIAQSQLVTSALPHAIPRALPYDEETFPYDLSKVNYENVVWSSEVSSLIKLLSLVGATLDGDFEFDLETASRDDVVTLGGFLSDTLIGQYIFGELVKDAIVGFEFAGLTEDDLDYDNITNWGLEVVRLYDIIQIVTDDDGNARDFATLSEEEATTLAQNLGTSELFTPILEDVVVNTIEEGGFDDIVPVEQLYFGTEVDPLDWVNELDIFLSVYRTINDIDFDNFTLEDLDGAEELLIDMLDSKIMYTNAYPYIFNNVAVKMGLDSIEGANFEVEHLQTEVHAHGKAAWENEITTLCDLYEEVDALGGVDAIETLTLKSIKDSGKSVSVVFKNIANLVLDSKILGIPTLRPIIIDTIDLGEDSAGNPIPLANTDDWTIAEWRTEIDQLADIISTLGNISEDYDFADVNLDVNEEQHNRNIGTLLNQAYDSALIGSGINTKITDIILGYNDINEYVDASVIVEVRGLKPGTASEGWIGEIEILQALRSTAEAYELGDPDSVSQLSKADLASILNNMKNSHITNYGLPKVVKNALVGVGIDDMLDYGLTAGQPSRFEALPFDMVKDHSNNEVDKLVELFSSVKELGDLTDIDWNNDDTTPKLADVIIDLVKTDLFNGIEAIPTSVNPATETDPDVLLLSGIFRNANLADTLDAVKIITIAGDDIVNEDVPGYVGRLEAELDLIIDIRNDLFVDEHGQPSDSMNHNRISADLLKKLNASDILLDDALPRILKEGLMTVGFDDYINTPENPEAFETMNFAAIKDDVEIDLLMGLYDFAKQSGDLSSVGWDSLSNTTLVEQLETVTTSNVIKPVRGIMVDNVLTEIGFDEYYLPSDIDAVDAIDAWAKEIKAIEIGLDLTKTLNDSSNKGLTAGDSNTYLIRAVMETADEAIVMNRILRGVLDEQMVALGVREEQFRWAKAGRVGELDLGDAAPALAGLIDLTKLMRDVKNDTVVTKLANNLNRVEDLYEITKPDYRDPLIKVNVANRIFNSLESSGNADGRTLVNSLMDIFIAEAVPTAAEQFENIDWATINYTDEVSVLQFAALVDSNYSPSFDRNTSIFLVGLLDQVFTYNDVEMTFNVNSPFALAFITATESRVRLNPSESTKLEAAYIGINPIKDGLARSIYILG